MSLPRFFVAENPFPKEDQTAEHILHHYRPRFLAKVEALDFEEIEQQPERPCVDVLYVNHEGTMEIYRIEITEYYDRIDEEQAQEILFKAHNFYAKYLQELESQQDLKPGYPVKDFSKDLPGLKILHAPDRWTIVYNGMVADFNAEEEMDEFLEHELGITPAMLDQGVINNFA